MKETNAKVKLLKAMLVILFCMGLMGVMFITIGGANAVVAHAKETQFTYEVKIKLNGKDYWVENEESISTVRRNFVIVDSFDMDKFKNYIGNHVDGLVEGMYVAGFKTIEDDEDAQSSSANAYYVIVPDYQKETYTIEYDLVFDDKINLTPIADELYTYDENLNLPIPADYSGYSFVCWTFDGEPFTHAKMPDMDNKTKAAMHQTFKLVAQWKEKEYKITFVLDNNQKEERTVTYMQPVGKLPTVADNGYEFLGFGFTPNGNVVIDNEKSLWKTASDATVYICRSTKPTQYKITYDGGGDEIKATTKEYNVTQLPLKLNYTPECGFDYIIGFRLKGVDLSGDNHDILPKGTVGDITLVAVWRASYYSESSSFWVTEVSYDDEYTIVYCNNINKAAIRTITIEPSVKEITFIGNMDDYVISKQIYVDNRTTPLKIRIKNLNWGSPFGEPLIDARGCKELTLECVDTNQLHGGLILEEPQMDFLAVIMCQNLTISGDSLTIIGAPAYTGFAGGNGIFARGYDENATGTFSNAVVISVTIDYLYVKGGQGGAGSDSHINGSDGGNGVVVWLGIVMDGHVGQDVYLYGGDGGTAKEGGTNGARGYDAGAVVQGPYNGSNGYVSGN